MRFITGAAGVATLPPEGERRAGENHAGPDERGFVLIGALLILVLLVLIGIAATTSTTLELQIAGVERTHRETFYQADGGTELGALVLEENLGCPAGFATALLNNTVVIVNQAFWMNLPPVPHPNNTNRDFWYPSNAAAGDPVTSFTAGGTTQIGIGGALQMAAGYMGRGKAAGDGGVSILYDLYSQAIGRSGSETLLHLQWRHSIGQEGNCNY